MPNKFDQKALEALVRSNLAENPMEEPSAPPENLWQGPVQEEGPQKPRGRAHWLMHLANMGTAGYDAYQADKMREWNQNEAGKTWAGLGVDPQGQLKINLSTNPTLPVGGMMGDNPSRGRVYGQTLGMAALNSLIAHFLPEKMGNISLGVNSALNGGMGAMKQWGRGKVQQSLAETREKNNMVEVPGIKLPSK